MKERDLLASSNVALVDSRVRILCVSENLWPWHNVTKYAFFQMLMGFILLFKNFQVVLLHLDLVEAIYQVFFCIKIGEVGQEIYRRELAVLGLFSVALGFVLRELHVFCLFWFGVMNFVYFSLKWSKERLKFNLLIFMLY